MRSKLQGRWYSLQDSSYSILFKKSKAIEIYEDEKEKYHCRISNKNCGVTIQLCNEDCFYLEKYNKKVKLCYLIKSLTLNSLTLVYEGGRVLDFVKKGNKKNL